MCIEMYANVVCKPMVCIIQGQAMYVSLRSVVV